MIGKLVCISNLQDLHKAMMVELVRRLQFALSDFNTSLESRFKYIFKDLLTKSDTYTSLLTGNLRKDFGLEFPANQVGSVINFWLQEISVRTIRPLSFDSHGLHYSVALYAIKGNFQDVLGAEGASYISINSSRKTAFPIPWLEWLLKRGKSLIEEVKGWDIKYGSYNNPPSRSSGAVMKRIKGEAGSVWQISELTGTVDNNWMTRLVQDNAGQLQNIVEEEFISRLNKAW